MSDYEQLLAITADRLGKPTYFPSTQMVLNERSAQGLVNRISEITGSRRSSLMDDYKSLKSFGVKGVSPALIAFGNFGTGNGAEQVLPWVISPEQARNSPGRIGHATLAADLVVNMNQTSSLREEDYISSYALHLGKRKTLFIMKAYDGVRASRKLPLFEAARSFPNTTFALTEGSGNLDITSFDATGGYLKVTKPSLRTPINPV